MWQKIGGRIHNVEELGHKFLGDRHDAEKIRCHAGNTAMDKTPSIDAAKWPLQINWSIAGLTYKTLEFCKNK